MECFNILKSKDLLYVPTALTFRNSVFCPQCIYVFCVDLRTNSDFFSVYSIKLSGFITEAECFLLGTNWVFKSDRYSFVLKG